MTTDCTAGVDSLLFELARRGIEIRVVTGRLRYRPKAKVTLELLDLLRRHSAALIETLSSAADADTTAKSPRESSTCVSAEAPSGESVPSSSPDRSARHRGRKVLELWVRTMTKVVSRRRAGSIADAFFDRWVAGDGARVLPPGVELWPAEYRVVVDATTRALGKDEWCRRSAEDAVRRFVRSHDPATIGAGRWTRLRDGSRGVWVQPFAQRTNASPALHRNAARPGGASALDSPSCPCCTRDEPVGLAWWARPRTRLAFDSIDAFDELADVPGVGRTPESERAAEIVIRRWHRDHDKETPNEQ
ncbi:MAG: hypothetical protein HYR85_20030 [Planctomycetes bacterium]|nr:hypothetical protein [Planctomycetota bacterium]MBI3844519.1 hypothetical protein [Planctomycetota bacterium]